MNICERFIEVVKRKPIYILWHIAIGFMASWVAFSVYWFCGADIFSPWIGFTVGSTAGLGVEGFQIVHIKWGQPLGEWLQESIMDILEYMLGASTVLFMLFIF